MPLVPQPYVIAAAEELERLLKSHGAGTCSDEFLASDHSALWCDLATGGWPLIGMAEEHGGVAMSLRDIATLIETWGRYLIPLPLMYTVLAHRWLPDAPVGVDDGLTFPIPSNTAHVAFVPFGSSSTVLNADGSVSAPGERDNLEPGSEDDFAPSLPMAVVRHDARLPAARRIELRALIAAEAVGCASAALRRTVEYLSHREAFGRPVIQFQALRHVLADVECDLELARTAVAWACHPDGGTDEPIRHALDRCRRMTTRLISVNGGVGYTWDFGLHFHLRHVVALEKLACAGR